MLHKIGLDALPRISSIYFIERQTVWQTCDRENILVLMVSGRCLFRMESGDWTAGPGELIFIPAGQEYQRLPLDDAPASFYYFHFSLFAAPVPASARELTAELTERQAQVYLSPDPAGQQTALFACLETLTRLPDDALSIAQEALSEYNQGRLESRLAYTLAVTRLIALASGVTVRRLLSENADDQDYALPAKLTSAIVYIRQNHARPLTAGEVCLHAGISRQHMIRLFRAQLGMTPIQYINRTKIMHAKDLIWRNSSLSIKEVAYELGFSDEHYFSRTFSHIVGETPAAFRERVRRFSSDSGRPR